jgi:hypothetical protein
VLLFHGVQLDGFGHSSSEPLLKSMGGFEAVFFGRCAELSMHNYAWYMEPAAEEGLGRGPQQP